MTLQSIARRELLFRSNYLAAHDLFHDLSMIRTRAVQILLDKLFLFFFFRFQVSFEFKRGKKKLFRAVPDLGSTKNILK